MAKIYLCWIQNTEFAGWGWDGSPFLASLLLRFVQIPMNLYPKLIDSCKFQRFVKSFAHTNYSSPCMLDVHSVVHVLSKMLDNVSSSDSYLDGEK